MVNCYRILLVLLYLLPLFLFSQEQDIDIVPRPSKIMVQDGEFPLGQIIDLYYTEEFASNTELLREVPGLQIGNSEQIKKLKKQHNQGLRLLKAEEFDHVDPNGYLLEIDEKGIY
ncbi:hypothetical protein [Sphingobacterium daejeonense]|uniref:hypothetical protein n=1 Tax=Sphingobacterium daejeonense TaxID=371142 RepID=UPI0010C39F78|nr:hypothetical protein [Sphingobacterium daejeonense]VTQ05694.1 Uncharacterised protein [Sphingobacterium daejeonense]